MSKRRRKGQRSRPSSIEPTQEQSVSAQPPERPLARRSAPKSSGAQKKSVPFWRYTHLPPWVPIALVMLVVVGVLAAVIALNQSGAATPAVAGVPCETTEKLNYHAHARLAIFLDGQEFRVPGNIGVTSACLYWLHTHDQSGTIHVEAPEQTDFSLGQFFRIWEQPLSSQRLLNKVTDGAHQIKAFVNGQPFEGDPAAIPLADGTEIVLQYGPPFPALP